MPHDIDFFDLAMEPGCTVNHIRVFARLRGFTEWRRGHKDYGWAWPSGETLASECGIGRRTVVRCLQWLAERGHIRSVARYDEAGHRTSNGYWMLTRDPTATPTTTQKRRKPKCHQTGTQADPGLSASGDTQAGFDLGVSGGTQAAPPKCQKRPRLSATMRGTGVPPGVPIGESPNGDSPEEPARNGNGKRRETHLTPYGDDWTARYGGEPPWGILAKCLTKPHQQLGERVLRPRWQEYLLRTEPAYVSVPKFVSTLGSYDPEAPRLSPRNARNRLALAQWRPSE